MYEDGNSSVFVIFRGVFNSMMAVEHAVTAFIVSRELVRVLEGGLVGEGSSAQLVMAVSHIPKGR